MTTTVRETRRAAELKPGDWLIDDEKGNRNPNEVMAAFQYPTADGMCVHLTTQVPGENPYSAGNIPLDLAFELATEAELAALREAADRARFAAGLREFADWIGANGWAPVGWDGCGFQHARVQVDLHGSDEDATAATVSRIRDLADRLGVKTQELDDRTDASVVIGAVSYSVIAWHRNGRPAEPNRCVASLHITAQTADARCFRCGAAGVVAAYEPAADPTGLAYSRADDEADDPTPVSPARVPLHTGGVVDGVGLVDETDAPLPKCLPGCRRTDEEYGKGSSTHADGCPEWAAMKARETESEAR
jgi:hypothetical protein